MWLVFDLRRQSLVDQISACLFKSKFISRVWPNTLFFFRRCCTFRRLWPYCHTHTSIWSSAYWRQRRGYKYLSVRRLCGYLCDQWRQWLSVHQSTDNGSNDLPDNRDTSHTPVVTRTCTRARWRHHAIYCMSARRWRCCCCFTSRRAPRIRKLCCNWSSRHRSWYATGRHHRYRSVKLN